MIESPLPLPPAPTTPAEWILPTLTRAQIARIETRGSVRQIQRGEVLVEAGEAVVPFFVVTAGQMEVVRPSGATETIIYQSKMHPTLTRNFEVFSATDWLAALTAHIPNAGEYLVRYYGWSSNVSRGKRRKAQGEESATIEEFNEVSASAAKRAWARLIKQVYEADPLSCPKCTGPMRIIAFIEQPAVIEKILRQLGMWVTSAHSPPAGYPLPCPPQRVSSRRNQLATAWSGPAGGHPLCRGRTPCAPTVPDLLQGFLLTAAPGSPDTPRIPGARPHLDGWGGPGAARRSSSGCEAGRRPDRRAGPKSNFLSPHLSSPITDSDAGRPRSLRRSSESRSRETQRKIGAPMPSLVSRRLFLTTLAALGLPRIVRGQPASKTARIAVLASGTETNFGPSIAVFRDALGKAGWVESQNLTLDVRYAGERYERLPGLMAELLTHRPDVITSLGTPATEAAKRATETIPIVMESLSDAVAVGLVSNLARPGGNVTGVSGFAPELSGKRLELIREIRPGATRIAILTNLANPATAPVVRTTESAAQQMRMQLTTVDVQRPEGLNAAFDAMTRAHSDAFVLAADPLLFSHVREIVALAARHRLPAVYETRRFAEAGGLLSYGPLTHERFAQLAGYVDRILRGARPGDLPVEQPRTFELVLNVKTAKALGLEFLPSLRLRADHVIE